MSLRRPRIKAAAILPPKRPGRDGTSNSTSTKQPKLEYELDEKIGDAPLKEKVLEPSDIVAKARANALVNHFATNAIPALEEVTVVNVRESGDKLFKCPPVVVNHRRNDSFSATDIKSDRSEDGSSQQDGSRSLHGPLSPIKFRQRIRPTPFFGMRRNSTQGYGSDMEDEPKRQRHTSISSNTGTSSNQRIRPPIGQRTRTESSCSNFSDYSRDQIAKPTRKSAPSEEYRSLTAKKEYLSRFSGKIPEKSHMKMSDLIYYNPTTNPMTTNEQQKSEIESNNAPKPVLEKCPPAELVDPTPVEKETNMPVPQLKLGPNGEMVLDEQSLVIETTAEKEARATLAKSNVIFMDEFSGSNGFYRRTKRTKDWSSDETIKFYRCLHTVGTDFSLMLTLFPNRSRRDLKLKFKKEERLNLNLINKALLHPKAFNIADLKQELDKEEQEYEAKQKEWDDIKKKVSLQKKKKTKLKGAQLFSKSARTLTHGDFVYENEVILPAHNEKAVTNQTEKCRNEVNTTLTENCREVDNKNSSPIDEHCPKIEPVIKCESSKTISHEIKNKCNSVQDGSILEQPENKLQPIHDTSSQPVIIRSIQKLHPIKIDNHITINEDMPESPESNTEDYTYPVQQNDIEILYEMLSSQVTPSKNEATLEKLRTFNENINISRKAVENESNGERLDDNIRKMEVSTSDADLKDVPTLPKDEIDAEMERFMLHDLGNILTNLINGSLVVVASEDENDSSKMINEIYVMCKETGRLTDSPLDLPEDVVNCIIEELNGN